MNKESPNYYAIIPANIRYDEMLKANEKLLYGEITALAQKSGKCFASNKYFAELYGVTNKSVSRWINKLKKHGYISIEMEHSGKQIINRYIKLNGHPMDKKVNRYGKLNGYPMDKKVYTPMDKKVKDNNTSINNTSINNNNKLDINNNCSKNNNSSVYYQREAKKNFSNFLSPAQIAKNFFENFKIQQKAAEYFSKKINLEINFCDEEIKKFASYWTEPSRSGKKQRWEMEKTFEVKRRLATWFSRCQNFFRKNNNSEELTEEEKDFFR